MELLECRVDLFLSTAFLINLPNTPFKVNGVRLPQYIIRSTEYIVEQVKFIQKEIVYTHVRIIALVYKVNDNYIAFLTISMTTPDPLLNPLRVPREIIIHDKGAELKVQALGCCFGGDHDFCMIPEMFNKGYTLISGLYTACFAVIGVFRVPGVINRIGFRLIIRAIKNDNFPGVAMLIQIVF